jgi:hypothetical protein
MSKYKAIRTEVDGITFSSKKESKRYADLKLLEKAGKIKNLHLQPVIPLPVKEEMICRYVADFGYWDNEKNVDILEDCKGCKTPVYRLKKKLVKAIYGIEILET